MGSRAPSILLLSAGAVLAATGQGYAQAPPPVVALCAPCHGTDGGSGNVEVPNLAGQHSIYLYAQLRAFRAGRRQHPDMKGVAGDLTDREIEQIVIYYSTLPSP
ncbi:MAG TPA: c-type cytochrome [Xanthobacteraceae bacterium]|nr:c-type cytochrome [Xanthobacteraceae bacterium]